MTPLDGSILKWEKICNDRRSVDNGEKNCPLCDEHVGCIECPVSEKAITNGCRLTPYVNWVDHQVGYHDGERPYRRQKGCKTCDELAQKELDFLKSLKA